MLLDTPEEAKATCLVWVNTSPPICWFGRQFCGPIAYLKEGDLQDSKQAKLWDKEAHILKDCITQLWKVRRALANVPIYMVFDDHDLSDDWYLNRAWCTGVLGKPLGKRVVQNGLLAYAVFQAWGNTPDQFQEGQSGGCLLKAATIWSASAGTDESASEEIAKYLGLPQREPDSSFPKFRLHEDVWVLDRDYPDGTLPLEWHYSISSLKHEVIVLDTRTWRGYPLGDAIAPPMLLCPRAFKQQLQKPLELSDRLKQTGESGIEVTFVVIPQTW
jgi:hypothetical protein